MARSQWWTRRAVSIHLTALVVVPGCLALCWWQLTRALGGNELSWAYVFEWPFFAGYAVYLWWKLLHEPPVPEPAGERRRVAASTGPTGEHGIRGEVEFGLRSNAASGGEPADEPSPDDPVEQERLAYNRYLAELAERGAPKRW